MAFWYRKDSKYVCVYVSVDGGQKQLPRRETRHLDAEPDHNVAAWVRDWERRNGETTQARPELNSTCLYWVNQYIRYMMARNRPKADNTLQYHRRTLETIALPYFLIHCALPDPNSWPTTSPRLTDYARTQGHSEHTIQKLNAAMRSFWTWLCDERKVLTGLAIRLRPPEPPENATPLPLLVFPDEMWSLIQGTPPAVEFLCLVGYYFSLRPQEIFALRPSDFRVGSVATQLECCRVMKRMGLFAKMVVHVTRQRRPEGGFAPPKKSSVGWTACFDERAAKRLVEILRGLPPDDLVLPLRMDPYLDIWRVHIAETSKMWAARGEKYPLAGFVIKDMRRASAYWLGHETGFAAEVTNLQKHLRHKDPKSTQTYLRRPVEEVADQTEWDMDA